MKVLVIGQDQEVVKNISFCLQLRWPDAIIVSAAEGSEGIGLVEAEAPDLVMADFSFQLFCTLTYLRGNRDLESWHSGKTE